MVRAPLGSAPALPLSRVLPRRRPRRGGGIGRRAWFRSMWRQPRGGSSPLLGTTSLLPLTRHSRSQTPGVNLGSARPSGTRASPPATRRRRRFFRARYQRRVLSAGAPVHIIHSRPFGPLAGGTPALPGIRPKAGWRTILLGAARSGGCAGAWSAHSAGGR